MGNLYRSCLNFSVILCLFLCSCTKIIDPNDNTLNYYVRTKIRTLDPASITSIVSSTTASQVYETLLHFHYLKRPIEIEPMLAESMPQISKDGMTYTFKIKKNIFFHDNPCFPGNKGRELTATDFIYSWKRLANPKNKSENFWIFKGKVKGFDAWRNKLIKGTGKHTDPIEGLQAPDSHTLIIKLTKPYYQLPYVLSMVQTAPIPKEAVDYYKQEFDSNPVGTGPFTMTNWIRGSRVTLERNPKYHEVYYPTKGMPEDKKNNLLTDSGKRLPFLEKIIINEISQVQSQYLLFLKGDLDSIIATKDYTKELLSDSKLKKSYQDKGMKLQLYPGDDVTYIAFNTENKFFRKRKLRQAMSLAYDQKTAIRILYAGLGWPAQGPIPPSLPGFDPNYKNPYRQFSLKKAKRLLAASGHPGGKGLPEFKYQMTSTGTEERQVSDYFKQQMALIGIKIRLVPNTWPQFSEKIRTKQADIFGMAWNADYPDAQNFLQLFYGPNEAPGPNTSNYKNKTFDRLYKKALNMPPSPERTLIYKDMQELLAVDAPWIFNIHRLRVIMSYKWLKNYKHSYLALDTMKYYRIDGEQRAKLKENL